MAKRYNLNSIKTTRSYSVTEISNLFKIHPETVKDWIRKKGLKVIDPQVKPFLIMGNDLKDFLFKEYKKRTFKLKEGEFFCARCKKNTKSNPTDLSYEFTGRKLGKKYKHVILVGKCVTCGLRVMRIASDRILQDLQKRGLFTQETFKDKTEDVQLDLEPIEIPKERSGFEEHKPVLGENTFYCSNTEIGNGEVE